VWAAKSLLIIFKNSIKNLSRHQKNNNSLKSSRKIFLIFKNSEAGGTYVYMQCTGCNLLKEEYGSNVNICETMA